MLVSSASHPFPLSPLPLPFSCLFFLLSFLILPPFPPSALCPQSHQQVDTNPVIYCVVEDKYHISACPDLGSGTLWGKAPPLLSCLGLGEEVEFMLRPRPELTLGLAFPPSWARSSWVLLDFASSE